MKTPQQKWHTQHAKLELIRLSIKYNQFNKVVTVCYATARYNYDFMHTLPLIETRLLGDMSGF